jgi:hypothetical protein
MLRRHDIHTLPKFIFPGAYCASVKQWNNCLMDQLRSLRVFTQVIAEGSFAGAARVLDMAPPVVTRAISDLEQHRAHAY